ncbi:glutamate--tRNA ligase [Candidatus Uhrbacteria bacterium]|nr:glutamate--tRNA ligase [Candidatus Uhrbacteria bacterium]
MNRVRFAPSPTGFLHIGGLRTALYNELFIRKEGGVFVLRIEDTDRTRLVPGGIENIVRTLAWSGIHPDEGPYLDANGEIKERGGHGPYIQSNRFDLYAEHAKILLEKGGAYRCFCTPERLESMKTAQMAERRPIMYDKRCRSLSAAEVAKELEAGTPGVIRLKMPDGTTEFSDVIRGRVSFENTLIDDQVLLKSDGFPTYHLANVVDDHLMEISHVIRGEDWLPSTPKHLVLYALFGWQAPIYAHLPLLLNPDRSKLSKRQNDVAVEEYAEQGYLPEAIVNFVALLGWNPTADRELYSRQELIDAFTLEKINRAGAVFNREKLDWMNREYIRMTADERLVELAAPFFANAKIDGSPEMFRKAIALEKQRVTTLKEFPEATAYLFVDTVETEAGKIPWKKSTPGVAKERLAALAEFLAGQSDTLFADMKAIEKAVLGLIVERGWTNAETLWPLRYALTGREASPSPFEVAWALGKDASLRRIEAAITQLS